MSDGKRVTPEVIQAAMSRVRRTIRDMEQYRPAPLGSGAELAHILPPKRRGALRFVASTEAGSRNGSRVDMAGVRLDTFELNPVVMFNHERDRLPIGRGETFIRDRTLYIDVVFDRRDRLARQVERKYRSGFLHAVSASFTFFDYAADDCGSIVVTDAELVEVSAVTVPADRWAVQVGDDR